MSSDLSVIVWRWGTRYSVDFVNRLRSMLKRHLHLPHQLFCITDDPTGLDNEVVAVPIWPTTFGRARRLQAFDPAVSRLFSERLLHLDIDCVITGDITPLVSRPEPLVIWRSVPAKKVIWTSMRLKDNPEDGLGAYNTSMLLRNADTFPTLWSDYCADPKSVESEAKAAGFWTHILRKEEGRVATVRALSPGDDDQAVISLYAKRMEAATWGEADGIYKWGRRGFEDKAALPPDAKIVFFNGSLNDNFPGGEAVAAYPWLQEHWR